MNSAPRVAVVVPCHDDGATLLEALESLEQQEPHELVVVDDGSTDRETLRTLDDLRALGTPVLRQENRGLSAARMAGVATTSAPYVQPLDADDRLLPETLTALADALDAHEDAAAAWGDVAVFGSFEVVVRSADRLDPWVIWHLDGLPPTPMVRRTTLERTGGWKFHDAYEDWDFWMALAEAGLQGVHVQRTTVAYRRRSDRMNAGALERHGELLGALRARHPQLEAGLRSNWRRSSAPLRMRLLFPVIDRLPGVAGRDRHRLRRLIAAPPEVLRARRARTREER